MVTSNHITIYTSPACFRLVLKWPTVISFGCSYLTNRYKHQSFDKVLPRYGTIINAVRILLQCARPVLEQSYYQSVDHQSQRPHR